MPDVTPLSKKEIEKLSRWAMVALAARCAMRVAPAFRPRANQHEDEQRRESLAFDTRVTLAAGLACAKFSMHPERATVAFNYTIDLLISHGADATSNAESAVHATAEAVHRAVAGSASGSASGCARAVAHATSKAATAAAVAASAGAAAYAATRSDYEYLLKQLPQSSKQPDATAPTEFFARPLWSVPTGLIPVGWDSVLENWKALLEAVTAPDIYERHEALLKGDGIDWVRAKSRVAEWMNENVPDWGGFIDPNEEKRIKDEVESGGRPSALGDVRRTEKDLLNRTALVNALEAMVTSDAQHTPFTIALVGDWGVGKTTVMEFLEKRLRKRNESAIVKSLKNLLVKQGVGGPKRSVWSRLRETNWAGVKSSFKNSFPAKTRKKKKRKRRFDIAWFNAWEYELCGNMAAALAQEVVRGMVRASLPGRWLLKLRFAIQRHEWQFVWLVVKLSAWSVGTVWLGSESLLILNSARVESGNVRDPLLGVAGVATTTFLLTLGKGLWKNAKHIFDHPLTVEISTYLKLPEYGEQLGQIPVLKDDIDALARIRFGTNFLGREIKNEKWRRRLVVFVDDLDRCSDECIAATFDAIRLVTDVHHVIVIVGIDHRIAINAIGEQYRKQSDHSRSAGDIARDYLGKIIQLPIRLTEPDDDSVSQFVNERLFQQETVHTEITETTTQTGTLPGGSVEEGMNPGLTEGTKPGETAGGTEPVILHSPVGGGYVEPPRTPEVPTVTADNEIDITAFEREMSETEGEREVFLTMARDFELRNPRQLTRLRNSFRMGKALRQAGIGKETLNSDRLLYMLFWLEFLHSQPEHARVSESVLWDDAALSRVKGSARRVLDRIRHRMRDLFDIKDAA